MLARARSQAGFTTIELLLAVLIGSVGVISLIGTFDVSRRVTSYSEMKEAASHVAEQKMEELRALDYGELALNGSPAPASSSDPDDPAVLPQRQAATAGTRSRTLRRRTHRAARDRRDGRRGQRDRRVVERRAAQRQGLPLRDVRGYDGRGVRPGAEHERLQAGHGRRHGRQRARPAEADPRPTLVGNPDTANGEGSNPLDSPNTHVRGRRRRRRRLRAGGRRHRDHLLPVRHAGDLLGAPGDRGQPSRPMRRSRRAGPAPAATRPAAPMPDLMGIDPPPAPGVTPPALQLLERDHGRDDRPAAPSSGATPPARGTVTTTDNTKGHMWVTRAARRADDAHRRRGAEPLDADVQRSHGRRHALRRVLQRPRQHLEPRGDPADPDREGELRQQRRLPGRTSATGLAFTLDFLSTRAAPRSRPGTGSACGSGQPSSAGADLVVLYDHPLHASFLQVNAE